MRTIKQLLLFLMEQKKYWLIPIVFVLAILGILVVVAESTVVAPFIYSLF